MCAHELRLCQSQDIYVAWCLCCLHMKSTAANRAHELLQKLPQKYLKQEVAAQPGSQMGRPPAVGKQRLDGSECQAGMSGSVQAERLSQAPTLQHSFISQKQRFRTRAQGGRKRRK